TTDDGRHFVNVELDSVGFLAAMTAIDGRSDRFGRDDHRIKARRRADGFVAMCLDDMERGAKPTDSLPPVHLVINSSMETFLNRPGAPAAETEYDVMLSGAAVGRLSCAAAITNILLDGKLLPVGVSKLKRRLSKREMRALRQMYPRCVRPGCRRPSSQCQAHHITWWSLGGKTRVEDMCMLCPFHHWQLHEGGYQMARREAGGFVFIPPQFARGPTVSVTA
ncbi:MAG: HNH endonuclease signature motif containing protein, partial [Candidatus Dormibacteria bacterium]